MKIANFFQQGFDAAAEQQNIDRQRKMAELLRQQSMRPLDNGRMVGNHFVPTAPTEGLAKMLQSYYGGQDSRAADAKQLALAKAIKGRDSEEFGKFAGMLTGTPASESQNVMPNEYGQMTNQPIQNKAVAPDLAGAYKYAAGASNPALQQFGVQGALTSAQEQAKLAQARALQSQQGQLWAATGGDPIKFVQAGGDAKLAKEFAESPLWGKEKLTHVNGQMVGEQTGKFVGSAIPKQADAANLASDLLIPDGAGKLIPNTLLIGAKKAIQRESRPVDQSGRAPAGYRYLPDGNMEAVPGGPADIKAQAAAALKATGATDVDAAIGTLRNAYDRLEAGGGITSTKKGSIGNAASALSSSGLGQVVGKTLGTNNQSARNDIEMTRPALLAALMKATGMSAKQMDSNAELKLWMKTATDPTLDVESNRRALASLERKYLGGNQAAPPPALSAAPAAAKAVNWGDLK